MKEDSQNWLKNESKRWLNLQIKDQKQSISGDIPYKSNGPQLPADSYIYLFDHLGTQWIKLPSVQLSSHTPKLGFSRSTEKCWCGSPNQISRRMSIS